MAATIVNLSGRGGAARLARAARANPQLAEYLAETHRFPELTWQQERELGALMRAGTRPGKPRTRAAERARQALIESNLRLVVSIARCYSYADGSNLLDLVGHGNIGLVVGVDKYDPARRCRLATHLQQWIRREVQRASVASTAPAGLHIPYEQARRSRPGDYEPAVSLDADGAGFAETLAPRDDGHDKYLMDGYGDQFDDDEYSDQGQDDDEPRDWRKAALARHLSLLTAIERRLVDFRFGLTAETLTLDEAAQALGLGITRARRIEADAMQKLRAAFGLSAVEAVQAALLTA